MYKIIEFTTEENYIEDFLKLPSKLYKENYAISSDEEKAIITRKHALSKYYDLHNFLVYRDSELLARCSVSQYKDDAVAYLGLYECVDDDRCSLKLFQHIENALAAEGSKEIIGPVDSSFYVKYRLKISGFENESYFGEPYNLDYYYRQFLNAGYRVKHKYSSKYITNLQDKKMREAINQRYNLCLEKGYVFKTLRDVKYDAAIKELYALFMTTYDVLPLFKHIELEEFTALFKYFKYIVNRKLVQLVYYEGELVSFAIILPDYKNYLYNRLTFKNIFKILKMRFFTNEYIGLYFGTQPGHYYTSKGILKKVYDKTNHKSSVLATLMKSDATTTKHFKEHHKPHSEYVLLSKCLV